MNIALRAALDVLVVADGTLSALINPGKLTFSRIKRPRAFEYLLAEDGASDSEYKFGPKELDRTTVRFTTHSNMEDVDRAQAIIEATISLFDFSTSLSITGWNHISTLRKSQPRYWQDVVKRPGSDKGSEVWIGFVEHEFILSEQ